MRVRLVNPIDQCITVETLVPRGPQTIVAVVDDQSGATETSVHCVDPDSVSAADGMSVSQAACSSACA